MMILIIVLIVCIVIYAFKTYQNKLSFICIKLTNVEEKINSTLIKRRALLEDSEKIVKEVLKTDKTIYVDLPDLSNSNLSMMELDRKLLVYINEFYLIKDKYKKLQSNEEFKKIEFYINETEDKLNAYKEYYNDTVFLYNKLIKRFPQIIVTFIKRKKEKEFFDKKSISDSDYSDFKY